MIEGMKSRNLLLVVVLLILSIQPLLAAIPDSSKKIALTFEEVPYMKPLGFWRPREVSNMILRTLEGEKIPAAGFLVQEKVEDDMSTYIILSDWVTRGHILGNQTWGDADLNMLKYEHFMEHLSDGQKYLRRIAKAHPFNYRYLRYPLLHEGAEPKTKKRIRKALARAEYQIAHVTVKTADWVFNRPYLDHERDPDAMSQVKKLYLDHISDSLNYAEKQSEAVFGRNIAHIMQLRNCIATAGFLPDLIAMLKERGYEFVSLPDALGDEAYKTEEDYVGPLGLSFTDRVAATKGMPFDQNSGVPSDRDMRLSLRDFKPTN
jgi:peptidoglycan/xylan/chitin deacetylase (PgdA/CDA1 family)